MNDKQNSVRRKLPVKNHSQTNKNSNMDILKKFRYNFHYWLRNCYQDGAGVVKDSVHTPTIISS